MTLGIAPYPDVRQAQAFQTATHETEYDFFPGYELESVFRLYGVPESQQFEIVSFLVSNSDLARILLEAVPHLKRVFGNAYRYLEVEPDPDGGEEEIFGVVLVKGEPEQALELLRQFDEMWFSEVTKETDNRLNFTVEIEDDEPV